MTTFNATSQAAGVAQFASGSFTSDNTLITLNIGFRPRFFQFINATDAVISYKFEGQAANARVNVVTAGTTTIVADSGIAFNPDNSSVNILAALAGNAKAISWIAFG